MTKPDDICADCGLERREHHHDGAAYGRCGQFSEVAHTSLSAANASDVCKDCGLERREHHYNGAAYGVCGQFSEIAHTPAQPEKMPTSRPVAFRVPRVVDDKLSKTEFRLFDDEDEARRAACDIGADYDGLFLVADRRAAFFAQPDPRLSAGNGGEPNKRARCLEIQKGFHPAEGPTCGWPECGCDETEAPRSAGNDDLEIIEEFVRRNVGGQPALDAIARLRALPQAASKPRPMCLCCDEQEVSNDGDECEFCRITYSVSRPQQS